MRVRIATLRNTDRVWFEELGADAPWTRLWAGYVLCDCRGIRAVDSACPACGSPPYDAASKTYVVDNHEIEIPCAFMGAEGRYEDYVFLRMLEREWKRPLRPSDLFLDMPEKERPAPRASIAMIFWTYLETRIERLLRACMRDVPARIVEELLSRNVSISARVGRVYNVLFETTYWRDLEDAGFLTVSTLLKRVRDCRNRFTHGSPGALDDELITEIVASLKREHESWIAVYNRRATLST